ncbi:MAG: hypothetical protein GWP02_05285, partial [Desulfobulbaceae bacterium]|nr:hypothetical protein [Desulfobulbaceae bacterium]
MAIWPWAVARRRKIPVPISRSASVSRTRAVCSWAFPSFNVADTAISVGAALLIIDALFLSGRTKEIDS